MKALTKEILLNQVETLQNENKRMFNEALGEIIILNSTIETLQKTRKVSYIANIILVMIVITGFIVKFI